MGAASARSRVSTPFDAGARSAFVRVQDALRKAIRAIPGDPRRPRELERALAIDKTLAWKIVRLATEVDPLSASRFLPGTAGMERFLQAASGAGGPAASGAIEGVRAAVAELEDFYREHAGDRASAELMLDGLASGSRDEAALKHRRNAYQANSFLFGVQATAHIQASILMPSADPERVDVATVGGLVALRRVRANVPWIIGRSGRPRGPGDPPGAVSRRPIDERAAEACGGLPLLAEFCTKPLPEVRRRETGDPDISELELAGGPIGERGAVTCYVGEVLPGVLNRWATAERSRNTLSSRPRTPCESHIFDVLVHESLLPEAPPRAEIHHELDGPVWRFRDHRPQTLLFVGAGVENLSAGLAGAWAAEAPNYHELLEHVFARIGQDPGVYRLYRLRTRYPVIPSVAWMVLDLAQYAG